jgi:hypothetical protein
LTRVLATPVCYLPPGPNLSDGIIQKVKQNLAEIATHE